MPCGVLGNITLAVEEKEPIQGFSSALSWSHYRTLAQVEHKNERRFYEIEAEKEGWSVTGFQGLWYPSEIAGNLFIAFGILVTTPFITEVLSRHRKQQEVQA